jgi:transcriptional regulator with XRE-family HTH domain
MPISKEQLIALLRDKDFRDHFTVDQIFELLALQVRQLREKREWTQAELGTKAGMQQVQVSRLENPDYTGSKITTLAKLANAFDVVLIVRFAPVSEFANWLSNLSADDFQPASYEEEASSLKYGTQISASFVPSAAVQYSEVANIDAYRRSIASDDPGSSVLLSIKQEERELATA